MRDPRRLPSRAAPVSPATSDRSTVARLALLLAAAAGVAAFFAPAASAIERTGKQVVDTACAACHATGKDGAPRIGDNAAWAKRATQGLSALTAHAVAGIRNMPAHGGSANVSDRELARAITYMVNQSGGNWIEPRDPGATAPRSGDEIVQMQCAKCHRDGVNGAPKIGDRAAWIPRMSKGLNELVRSAVHGHGAMPARGGIADLTDREIESAVVYMFNQGVVAAPVSTPPPAAAVDPFEKRVDGMEVHLGIVRAESMSAAQRPADIATGKGYHHVNISLADLASKAPLKDAHVKVRVVDATGVETKTLERITVNDLVSYGAWFRLRAATTYSITAQIERPGGAGTTEAVFQYKVR